MGRLQQRVAAIAQCTYQRDTSAKIANSFDVFSIRPAAAEEAGHVCGRPLSKALFDDHVELFGDALYRPPPPKALPSGYRPVTGISVPEEPV